MLAAIKTWRTERARRSRKMRALVRALDRRGGLTSAAWLAHDLGVFIEPTISGRLRRALRLGLVQQHPSINGTDLRYALTELGRTIARA